jgi:antitoxin VapB
MATARVFKSGNSQAVRLPKEFRFDVNEVEIIQQGNTLILRKPEKRTFSELFARLKPLPEDFEWERPADPPPEPIRGWDDWEAALKRKSQKKKHTSSSQKPKQKRSASKTA